MRSACLIPTTRPETVETAKASAEADGWDVLVEWDHERTGASATRNRLFDRARDEGYEVVRYLDDDDVVLPHREACLEVIQAGIDVAYHDVAEVKNGKPNGIIRQIKDPKKVFWYPPDTWGWVARVDALERVRQACDGILWPPFPLGEAYFVFLEMVRNQLTMKHLPILAYEYRVGSGLHEHPDGQLWMERYRVEAFKLHLARIRDGIA